MTNALAIILAAALASAALAQPTDPPDRPDSGASAENNAMADEITPQLDEAVNDGLKALAALQNQADAKAQLGSTVKTILRGDVLFVEVHIDRRNPNEQDVLEIIAADDTTGRDNRGVSRLATDQGGPSAGQIERSLQQAEQFRRGHLKRHVVAALEELFRIERGGHNESLR